MNKKLEKVLIGAVILLILGSAGYGLYSLVNKVNTTETQTQQIATYLNLAIHFNVLPSGQVLYQAAQQQASSTSSTAPVATTTATSSAK